MISAKQILLWGSLALLASGCNPDINGGAGKRESDARYVGQAVGNFSADEWYPAGRLGTTLNITEGCYQDPAPAVDEQEPEA